MDHAYEDPTNTNSMTGLTISLHTLKKTTIRRTQNGHIRAEGSAPTLCIPDNNNHTTFPYFIQKQPQWIRELLQTNECLNDLSTICTALGMATAAWIITTSDSPTECLGALEVPGETTILESYRAEINDI